MPVLVNLVVTHFSFCCVGCDFLDYCPYQSLYLLLHRLQHRLLLSLLLRLLLRLFLRLLLMPFLYSCLNCVASTVAQTIAQAVAWPVAQVFLALLRLLLRLLLKLYAYFLFSSGHFLSIFESSWRLKGFSVLFILPRIKDLAYFHYKLRFNQINKQFCGYKSEHRG